MKENRDLLSHNSGGKKSRSRLLSLKAPGENLFSASLPASGVAGHPWHPLVCGSIQSLSPLSHGLLPCLCASSPFLIRTPIQITLREHPTLVRSHLNLYLNDIYKDVTFHIRSYSQRPGLRTSASLRRGHSAPHSRHSQSLMLAGFPWSPALRL